MAKREAQTFEWNSVFSTDGDYLKLEIIGRKETEYEGKRYAFDFTAYPENIVEQQKAAGHKAVFQQRTSQCKDDEARIAYWKELHEMFVGGEWEREGGKRGAPIVGAWVEVLADKKGVSVGVIQASLADYDKDERDAMRKTVEEKYADEIVAWKAKRKTIDLSEI